MTSISSPTLEASQRAWRYWFADGFTNLLVGTGILLMSYCLLDPPRWPPKLLPMFIWALALFLYVSSMIRHRQIVEWLKARMTYPRTGYVQPPQDCPEGIPALSLRGVSRSPEAARLHSSRRNTTYLMLGLTIVAAVAMIAIHQRWVWTAAGLIIGLAMAIARRQYRMTWIVPVGFPIVGLLTTLYVTSRQKAPAVFLVGWGVLFVLDGGTALTRYLLQNPAPKAPTA
jgi:hypothetical protein